MHGRAGLDRILFLSLLKAFVCDIALLQPIAETSARTRARYMCARASARGQSSEMLDELRIVYNALSLLHGFCEKGGVVQHDAFPL